MKNNLQQLIQSPTSCWPCRKVHSAANLPVKAPLSLVSRKAHKCNGSLWLLYFRNLGCREWLRQGFSAFGESLKSIVRVVCIVLLVCGISGCVTLPQDTQRLNDQVVAVPLPVFEQAQAINDEEEYEYLLALRYWKTAKRVIDDKVVSLSKEVKRISQQHLEKAIAYYEGKKSDEAFWEFVEALRHDPSNSVALDYLKKRYEANRFVLYMVREGETYEKVAEAVYGTFADEFLVVHFSDWDNTEKLVEGAVLKLPLLESFYSQGLLDYKQEIGVARKLFYAERFEELLPISEKILEKNPGDLEASYLVNISLLRIGEKLKKQEKFEEALVTLHRVRPSFENVNDLITEVRQLQREHIENKALFTNSGLLLKGEMLTSHGKYLEALQVLLQVEQGFEGRDKAVFNVKKKLKKQAEIHYKQGVKFFVGENLEKAIAEWEKALSFNPFHPKAMNDIEKARRLLEEFKAID